MSIVGLLLLILVGAICGMIAEALVGFRLGGFLVSAFVGFLGALFGTWLARRIGLPSLLAIRIEGHTIEIVWAVLGAMILLLVLGVLRRGAYSRRVP